MKTILIIAALAFLPLGFAGAASDYYLKLDGVEGEATAPSAATAPLSVQGSLVIEAGKGVVGTTIVLDGSKSQDDGTVGKFSWRQVSGPMARLSSAAALKPSFVPTSAGTYVFELQVADATGKLTVEQRSEFTVGNNPSQSDTVASPGTGEGKGKVEYDWKVEEGESAPAIEPDEIDVADDSEPITPDFGILLGGGGGGIDDDEAEEGRAAVADILLQGMQEAGMPAENVSLNFEKIKTKVSQPLKLFGIFPMSAAVTVEIDAEERVQVRFPWWAFLASGKQGDALGERVVSAISNVLKTKHDTIKNSIGNIR